MYGKEYYDEMNKKEARKQRWEKAKFPVAVILVALVLVGVAMYTNVIPNPFVKAPVDLPMTVASSMCSTMLNTWRWGFRS